jgi:DNA excision repair protein ERCC-1
VFSLEYHRLHPDYIHYRLKQLGKLYTLRVLLVWVDIEDQRQLLNELSTLCSTYRCTLILSWRLGKIERYDRISLINEAI